MGKGMGKGKGKGIDMDMDMGMNTHVMGRIDSDCSLFDHSAVIGIYTYCVRQVFLLPYAVIMFTL